MKKIFFSLLFAFCPLIASAQVTIVKNSRPTSRIVVTDTLTINKKAANLLQKFIYRMSDATLPIMQDVKTKKGDILIGGTTDRAKEDGFLISTDGGVVTIKSGGDKGCVMGVVHLLKNLGCDYLSKDIWWAPRRSSITLDYKDWTESPAFRYRQTQFYGALDRDYKLWYGLEEPHDMFAANMWVHTFNQILPSRRFGKAHPEWYSLINGKRQPGEHSQWCLTNPEVFEAAAKQIDSIFKAHPGMNMISVSQNDGNNTNCQCPDCKKIEEEEGSPSGPIIYFLNKLAKRFPDKEFSTLAYLFSMQPPRHIKPLPNVNIMLCDIDCKREVPLTDNESGRDFMRAITGWSKISDNIYVWDYGINFDNQVSPFPNFHILQPNMQIFRDNHANMLFEQVNGAMGTDFAELRSYMICNLMWNPDQDADSLMRTFCDRYYTDASPYIYKYLMLQQGALLSSGTPLWIYDSPISHKKGMLNHNLMATYTRLFDKAEDAVTHYQPKECESKEGISVLERVKLSRLPLQYSELEMARTENGVDKEAITKKLAAFKEGCTHFGVESLNERHNTPTAYCDLYLKRFIPQEKQSLAKGCKVTFLKEPSKAYQPIAGKALTDGLYGGTTYVESWVGWCGEDGEFIIDLGAEKPVKMVSCDFLHQLGAWILLPKSVSYMVSNDGKTFRPFGDKFNFAEDRDTSIKFVEGKAEVATPETVRYIKVYVQTLGMCPSWHYGIGYPAWFFLDEVNVY